MAIKNLNDFRRYKDRRSERMAAQGILLEDTVEQILSKLQRDGKILRFIRHSHCSPEDLSGKDFTVVFSREDAEVECSFGVTISNKSWQRGKTKHHDVVQFCWPIGTNPQTMENRILGLLNR